MCGILAQETYQNNSCNINMMCNYFSCLRRQQRHRRRAPFVSWKPSRILTFRYQFEWRTFYLFPYRIRMTVDCIKSSLLLKIQWKDHFLKIQWEEHHYLYKKDVILFSHDIRMSQKVDPRTERRGVLIRESFI
jgi:hypothetical protein